VSKNAFNLLIVPAVILIVWAFVAHLGIFNSFLLPPPEQVLESFGQLIKDGTLETHILASSMRSLGGFCIAALIALPTAYICYYSTKTESRLKLVMEALRFIPPLSLVPLLILWLGIGEASKVAIVILASFFPIYFNALSGFRQIDKNFTELATVLRLNKKEKFFHVELPGSLPSVLTGLRLGFGYSWRALVGAELIAASSGLGYLIGDASEMSQTDKVFVGIFSIAILGILGDQLFVWITHKFSPWMKK